MIQRPAPSLTTTIGWDEAFGPDGTRASAPCTATATPGHCCPSERFGTFPGLAITILPAPTTVETGRFSVIAPPHVVAVPPGLFLRENRNGLVGGMGWGGPAPRPTVGSTRR